MDDSGKSLFEAKNWYKDRYQYVLVQRKLLAVITILCLIFSAAAAVVILQLIPLKTIEPFVIQVDQKSGVTQTVDPLTIKELTANEAVNNYFVVQYMRAREKYNISDLAQNYNLVRVMSESRTVYPQFVGEADPNNPRSNAARLGSFGERTIKIKSITYLGPQRVQVRFFCEEKGGAGGIQHKIALMSFEYVKMSLTTEERYLNPLGFRVTEYRVDEDVMTK